MVLTSRASAGRVLRLAGLSRHPRLRKKSKQIKLLTRRVEL